jgi:hypothetical protein
MEPSDGGLSIYGPRPSLCLLAIGLGLVGLFLLVAGLGERHSVESTAVRLLLAGIPLLCWWAYRRRGNANAAGPHDRRNRQA